MPAPQAAFPTVEPVWPRTPSKREPQCISEALFSLRPKSQPKPLLHQFHPPAIRMQNESFSLTAEGSREPGLRSSAACRTFARYKDMLFQL